MRDTADVGSILGSEDPSEEEMAIHSSILVWENPVDTGAWRSQSTELEMTEHTHSHFSVTVFTTLPDVEELFLSVCPGECAH